jgi:hypothetical protein
MAQGRGRLSSFDLLPREADPILTWALSELADRAKTQTDIYAEFVSRCEALMKEHRGELEFVIPAFSSFNRYSLKHARLVRRTAQTNEIVAALADKHTAKSSDDLTVLLGETIKELVFHMLGEKDDDADPKEVLFLANAFKSAQQAQNLSSTRRAKEDAKLAQRVDEALGAVAKVKGMTAETAEAIKAQILGVTG